MIADLSGHVLLDRYRLDSWLARGGMAEVYQATDTKLERPVAVKLLHGYLAADRAYPERLRREVQAIVQLDHTNIVKVYDRGDIDGRPFVVMELVDGESLAEVLRREKTLRPQRSLAVTEDVLAALEHAHNRDIVHRDVKPDNVLIAADGHAKLVDFGIAQPLHAATLSDAGQVVGSVLYMAPERLAGRPATAASDLYSLGTMLYEMLTGQNPFEADVLAAVAAQHWQREPQPPSTLCPELPRWLDDLVVRALAKDPDARYDSATSMLADLSRRRALHNAPTGKLPAVQPTHPSRSRPYASVSRALFWRTRGRLAFYGIAVALLLLLLGTSALDRGRSMSSTDREVAAAPVQGTAAPISGSAARTAVKPLAAEPIPQTPTSVLPTPTAKPQPTPTALQRLGDLQAQVQNAIPRGDAGKEERDILKRLGELKQEVVEGDLKDAGSSARELLKQVREAASKGKIDQSLADQIAVQLTLLLNQW